MPMCPRSLRRVMPADQTTAIMCSAEEPGQWSPLEYDSKLEPSGLTVGRLCQPPAERVHSMT